MSSALQPLVAILSPLGVAILIAVTVMIIETWLVGRDPLGFLKNLRQPDWALPDWAMMIVPIFFYGVGIYAVAKALGAGEAGELALGLTVAVLLGNAVMNHFSFGRRRVDWAFLFSVPLVLLAAFAAYAAHGIDAVAGVLLGLVFLSIAYDGVWLRALGDHNPELTGRGGHRD